MTNREVLPPGALLGKDYECSTSSMTYSSNMAIKEQLGLRLVLGVCRLGDADLAGWWSSHGLDEVGEYVLADLFPRTWRASALQLSLLSASKRHYDFLPDRPNIVHLFSDRLGVALRAREFLAELKTGGDEEVFDTLQGWTSRSSAEASLKDWAGPTPEGERVGQALRVGVLSADAMADPEQQESAARLLAASFLGQAGELLIPYFDVAI